MSWRILRRMEATARDGRRHERLELSHETFLTRERDHATGLIHDYWRALGPAPAEEDFRPAAVLDASQLPLFGMIDCRAASPARFVMRAHTRVAPAAWSTALEGVRLVDFPDELHAAALAYDYYICAARGEPVYHEIEHAVAGVNGVPIWRHYARILLPLTDGTGRVTAIAYATRRFVTPDYRA